MGSKHSMTEHLRKMSATIHGLNTVSNVLIEEKQNQVALCAVESWDTMKLTLTHKESITVFTHL